MTEEDQGQDKSWLERLAQAFSTDPKTLDDVAEVLRVAHNNKILDDEALEIMEGALHVSDQQVREIMLPRSQMVVISQDAEVEEILHIAIESNHSRFPVIGVMFYFHTPYYGYDELYLDRDERGPLIDRLMDCARAGLPVLNSRAGLRALRSGKWPRPLPIASVLDVDGESVCCRATDDVCEDCGYAVCTELTELQRLRPSAVRAMLKYW